MIGPHTADHDAVDQLAESFVTRYRAGERLSVDEYAQQYPELAETLRELLPTLALLEQRGAPNMFAADHGSPPFTPPNEIGEFTIVREVGRGGMGVVYEAIQQSLGRHIALKVLSAPGQLDPTQQERFRQEARAAARLQHEHIVPVYGVGEQDGLRYYVMQFIQGSSLDVVINELRQSREGDTESTSGCVPIHALQEKVIEPAEVEQSSSQTYFGSGRNKRESYQRVAQAGLQVAEALAYAHDEGILHRDIKPSNLIIDRKGNLWITDFGLAKDERADQLTQTGDFVGTLRYMAPERLDGWSDRRSDIYSLGATLYELLTLQLFLNAATQGKLVEHVLHRAPVAPAKFDTSIPRDLETIILKATAKEPANRYRTADEMAEDLRLFLSDRPILSCRAAPIEQFTRWCRRNPIMSLLAGAVAALLVVTIVVLLVSNARIRNESAALAIAVHDKDVALTTAQEAINQMLTRVASKTFADMPKSHPLRVALLEDALKFYGGLVSQEGAQPKLRYEMANILVTMSLLQRELGCYDEAVQALKQSIELFTQLVANDPDPPSIRERLANAELDLAYTLYWGRNPTETVAPEVELQCRKALERFDELERDWPGRRQPAVLCLRILSDGANQRGDQIEALRLLQEAIARGEAYVKQHPDSDATRAEIGRTCAKQWDRLTDSAKLRSKDGEHVLNAGLHQVDEILKRSPGSTQAADLGAALHFRLALQFFNEDRVDDAMPQLNLAITGIEQLCANFPYNTDYWNSAEWFNFESVKRLHAADRAAESQRVALTYFKWLKEIAPQVADKPESKAKLAESQAALVASFHILRMDHEAEQAALIVSQATSHSSP